MNILLNINPVSTFSDDNFSIKGHELSSLVDRYTKSLQISGAKIAIIICDNNLGWLIIYLSCLKNNIVPILAPKNSDKEYIEILISSFKVGLVLDATIYSDIYDEILVKSSQKLLDSEIVDTYPDLALIMTTSGSTGSPKCVLLSSNNLTSNALAIANYLNLDKGDLGLVQLPTFYSYGLSIVNSHLAGGCGLHFTNLPIFDANFLPMINNTNVTNISGVPSSFEMLFRIGFLKKKFNNLRFITQAGGNLLTKHKKIFNDYCLSNNLSFFVMYGQTEASPRIAYVPPEKLATKLDCIGIAIPGGRLSIDQENGELVYEGPNVMLGYASNFNDLAAGDINCGLLRTGDIAEEDADGYFKVIGRLKRIIKITGIRYNLDDIEKRLSNEISVPVFACGEDEKLLIYIEGNSLDPVLLPKISQTLKIHKTKFTVLLLENIPKLANGKTDYSSLNNSQEKS